MEWEKKVIEKYCCNSGKGKYAEIRFVNGEFQECGFGTSSHIYTLDDWRFLVEVGKKIIELQKEYDKKWRDSV